MKALKTIIAVILVLTFTTHADAWMGNSMTMTQQESSGTAWDTTSACTEQYKLNDNAASSVITASVGGNLVYRNNIGPINTSTGSVAGKIGLAMDFEGSIEYANGTLPTVFDGIATKDHSISLWMNADTLTGGATFDRIFEAWFDANNFVQIATTQTTNEVQYIVEDATTHRHVRTSNILSTGAWFHVVGTWDASENTVRIYLNGVEHSNAGDNATGGDTQEMRIGSRTDAAALTFYNGRVDDLRIYVRVLTTTEILGIYNNGAGTEDLSGTI